MQWGWCACLPPRALWHCLLAFSSAVHRVHGCMPVASLSAAIGGCNVSPTIQKGNIAGIMQHVLVHRQPSIAHCHCCVCILPQSLVKWAASLLAFLVQFHHPWTEGELEMYQNNCHMMWLQEGKAEPTNFGVCSLTCAH
jgi:hypothetical protein